MKDESVEVKQDGNDWDVAQENLRELRNTNMPSPFAELDALLKAQDLKPATQDDTRGNS